MLFRQAPENTSKRISKHNRETWARTQRCPAKPGKRVRFRARANKLNTTKTKRHKIRKGIDPGGMTEGGGTNPVFEVWIFKVTLAEPPWGVTLELENEQVAPGGIPAPQASCTCLLNPLTGVTTMVYVAAPPETIVFSDGEADKL